MLHARMVRNAEARRTRHTVCVCSVVDAADDGIWVWEVKRVIMEFFSVMVVRFVCKLRLFLELGQGFNL